MYYIVVSDKLGGRFAETAKTEKQAFAFMHIHKGRGAQSVDIYQQPFHTTTDEKALVAFYGKGSYWDNVSKKKEELISKKIE